MSSNRLTEILELLGERERTSGERVILCSFAAEIVGLTGAGIGLMSERRNLTSVCTSSPIATGLMDLEKTVGEGPCLDACTSMTSIDEDDLKNCIKPPWIAYAPQAVDLGAGAVFAFPIRLGAIRLGALAFYREEAGPLDDQQVSDAHLMASVSGRAVLAMQSGASPGGLARDLEREGSVDFVVHQAAGMVAVQGSMEIGDALATLRSHAFSLHNTLSEVAQRIVERQISWNQDRRLWQDGPVL